LTATSPTARRIEYLRLSDIRGADVNPKDHDLPGLRRSIGEYGFTEAPLLDERTGRLVAGHGRLKDLQERRNLGAPPPEGIGVDSDGEWLIPVIRGWASETDAHARAYLTASNKLSENGGWDYDVLPDYLRGLAEQDLLPLTGFTEDELAALLEQGPDPDTDIDGDPDDPGDVPAEPITAPGDLWQLGRHRLICGDATDVTAVETLIGARRCDMMWTDPPYGVDYVGKTKDALTIQNDAGPDGLGELLAGAYAAATVALVPGAPVYVAHPDSFRILFETRHGPSRLESAAEPDMGEEHHGAGPLGLPLPPRADPVRLHRRRRRPPRPRRGPLVRRQRRHHRVQHRQTGPLRGAPHDETHRPDRGDAGQLVPARRPGLRPVRRLRIHPDRRARPRGVRPPARARPRLLRRHLPPLPESDR
jgi:hypothetical protein